MPYSDLLKLVLLYTCLPVGAALIGGLVASWRTPSPPIKSAIQHLAAGVVFAATALELLPQEREGQAFPLILGFGIGLGVMLMIRWLARRWQRGQSRQSVGLLAVTGLDLWIDGLVLGIGFVAGQQTGMLLVVALTVEVLFWDFPWLVR